MKFRTPLIAAALLASGIGSSAHAALEGRDLDGNLATIEANYDTDIDITWLADLKYGAGSSYDDGSSTTDGYMSWAHANAWAASLSFTDGINVYDNWRLPISDTCGGYNCSGSELGHWFYSELGGIAREPIWTTADPDLAKFTNLEFFGVGYTWAASEFVISTSAYVFTMFDGGQGSYNKLETFNAWAVSSGDVGIAAVPEPETWALLLAGLGLVGFAARRSSGAGAV